MPRQSHTAFGFLLLLSLLSGCTQPSPAGETSAPHPSDLVVSGLNTTWNFVVGAAAGVPGEPGKDVRFVSSAPFDFNVPPGLNAFNVTATWTCASPTCSLRVNLFTPGHSDGGVIGGVPDDYAEGPSPLHLTIKDPAQGSWTLTVTASGADAVVQGQAEIRG